MFKKVNNYLETPWTIKSYLKANAVCVIIYGVLLGIYSIVRFWDDILEALEKFRNKILNLRVVRFFRRGRG